MMLRRLLYAAAVGAFALGRSADAQEDAATKAIEAAKQFAATTITITAAPVCKPCSTLSIRGRSGRS